MPRSSRAGTPTAVFFDPTGRRRRLVRALLLVVICGTVILTALGVIGLTVQAAPPRVVVGTSARHSAGAQALAWPAVAGVEPVSHIRSQPR